MIEKSMEEVLIEHQRQSTDSCLCGWAKLGHSHPAHQAAALAAAGFGPLHVRAPEVRCVDLATGEKVLDEVVASNAMVHLEVMDDNHWWMAITAAGKRVDVNLYTKRAKITAVAEVEP